MRRDTYTNTTTHVYHLYTCAVHCQRAGIGSSLLHIPHRAGLEAPSKGMGISFIYALAAAIYTSTFFQYTCRRYLKASFSMITAHNHFSYPNVTFCHHDSPLVCFSIVALVVHVSADPSSLWGGARLGSCCIRFGSNAWHILSGWK